MHGSTYLLACSQNGDRTPQGLKNFAPVRGFLGQASKAVPHYWASKALYGVIARGQYLPDIAPELAILLGFTVLFWLIGVWQFDFD